MQAHRQSRYTGRFAPSPTGPLHAGSLLVAIASFLDARAHDGVWLLRIEDIDPPREVAGASDHILRLLDAASLNWDGDYTWQSANRDRHERALEQLRRRGLTYVCECSRREVAAAAQRAGLPAGVYPGTCRGRSPPLPGAIRVRTRPVAVTARDRRRQPLTQNLETDVGDFIVRRRDGLIAYQLAVVVDDAAQGVTDVVRGDDLWDNTPRQLWLQELLGLERPRYLHLPLVLNAAGDKLSKQTGAPALELESISDSVFNCLISLNLCPPDELRGAPPGELLDWATPAWHSDRVKNVASIDGDAIAAQQNPLM